MSTDIFGARSNSLKPGIQTTRSKHPLDQNYQYPGHSELEQKSPFSMTKKEAAMFAKTSLMTAGAKLAKKQVEEASGRVSPKALASQAQKFDSFINA